jgi:hypothetical protein
VHIQLVRKVDPIIKTESKDIGARELISYLLKAYLKNMPGHESGV